jgi:hypothetical protein
LKANIDFQVDKMAESADPDFWPARDYLAEHRKEW